MVERVRHWEADAADHVVLVVRSRHHNWAQFALSLFSLAPQPIESCTFRVALVTSVKHIRNYPTNSCGGSSPSDH